MRRLYARMSQRGDSRLEGALFDRRSPFMYWLWQVQADLSRRLYRIKTQGGRRVTRKKRWYDYLWIWPILYFALGFFNILFAWLGMIDFLLPLFIAIIGGNKFFCNRLCGRGQLFAVLPRALKCSRQKPAPAWLSSRRFRYAFLLFFLTMFGNIVHQTCLVYGGAKSLSEVVKLFWTFRVPWDWAYTAGATSDWIAEFSFGFYSLMLTSTLIGLIVMALYRPRTWCSFCPMGCMTQLICEIKSRGEQPD